MGLVVYLHPQTFERNLFVKTIFIPILVLVMCSWLCSKLLLNPVFGKMLTHHPGKAANLGSVCQIVSNYSIQLHAMNQTEESETPVPAKLLFVDDEPNILKSLKRLFRSSEYSVFQGESGVAALEILNRHEIDLVISDMRMPEMDGAELLTQVAERWPDTVRILLTGYADLNATVTAVNKGKIYSYCSKPWVDFDLKALVDHAIEQKRLREERQQLFTIINNQNRQLKELNEHLEDRVQRRTEQLKLSLQRLDEAHNALKLQFTEPSALLRKLLKSVRGLKAGIRNSLLNMPKQ